MGEDEAGTAKAVRERREAAEEIAAAHGGRTFKTMGDAVFIEFPSIVEAVECAIAMQAMAAERNAEAPEDKHIVYRIGVNLGDVLIDGDDLLGEGVNIAARLEGVAAPGGVCLSGWAFEQVRGRVDAEFFDLGEIELKNIVRPVQVYALKPGRPARAMKLDRAGPPRLSIVVMPFANIGGGPEQGYFADGVTENLTTDLSQMRGASVIARNTAFLYKGKPVDARQIGRELNVRYVLEGSVQRSRERLRVNVQLIDAESGSHLWADRFDKPVADLFDMQDEIVARVANQLDAQLVAVEARRAASATNPDAMDLYFQGLAWRNRGLTPEFIARARDYFLRALELDPENVGALINLAYIDFSARFAGLRPEPSEFLASAEAAARKAVALAPNSPGAHAALGMVLAFTRRPADGVAELERAIALDRNLAGPHANIGMAKILLGRPEEAVTHIEEALRISPRDSFAFNWMAIASLAEFAAGRDEQAVAWGQRSINANPNNPIARYWLAAALAHLGRVAEARAALKDAALVFGSSIRDARAGFTTLSDDPIYLAQCERLLDGLRKAGMPEE